MYFSSSLLQFGIIYTVLCLGDGRTGRTVPDYPAVPLHGLAGAGRAQVRRGLHRLYRPGAQDQGAVRAGGTNHGALQVSIRVYSVRIRLSIYSTQVTVQWNEGVSV
mgnify:CR=1 FL=1